MFSHRVRTIKGSATLEVNRLRLELEREGRKVFNFGAGEPDFDTPEFIIEAGQKALKDGWTRYTAVAGAMELREEVAKQVSESRGISVSPEEVIISSGAKQALFEAFCSQVDSGDEVLLPVPYWVSYPEMIRFADGLPMMVPTKLEDSYKASASQFEEYITPRTVGLVLNSPSNPTGSVYSAEEVESLVELAEENEMWILSDEIYERYLFDGQKLASPLSGTGRERTVMISGVSKTYSMTGWRIGWAVGPKELISAMTRLQSHAASNPCAVSQAATLAALRCEDETYLEERIAAFDARRRKAIELLQKIDGLKVFHGKSTFYLFVDASEILKGDHGPSTSLEFCQELLQKKGVATVPGAAFGDDMGVRLAYATSMEDIEEGVAALAEYVQEIT